MGIDLMKLEPTVVSRDLRGKIVMFYGEPKSGKTSTAVKFPNHLLVAFERGYNAINNVMAQPTNNWREFKQILRDLKKKEVQERFETIIIDTLDIAWDACEEYICNREGVEKIGDIPYGGGYSLLRKEFDTALREIPLMGFGLVLISHSEDKTHTLPNGEEYQRIEPTLPKRPMLIANRMADIIGYSRSIQVDGENKVNLYIRGTQRFVAGSRWKHTPDVIEFTYDNLVNAIADAIEAQSTEDGVEAQDEHVNVYEESEKVDYKVVKKKIDETIAKLMKMDINEKTEQSNYVPIITNVIEEHFGVGRHLSEAGQAQVDVLLLIEADLSDILKDAEKKATKK